MLLEKSRQNMKTQLPKQLSLSLLALGLPSTSQGQFALVEDFETNFTIGETVDGINGWSSTNPARATAAEAPLNAIGTAMLVTGNGPRNDVFRPFDSVPDDGVELQIADGATGTLYLEMVLPAEQADTANGSVGLTSATSPVSFGSFASQLRLRDDMVTVRNGGAFNNTGFDFDSNARLQFWLVIDNANDVFDVYLTSPSGETGQILVGEDFGFRTSDTLPLINFYNVMVSNGAIPAQDMFIDNIYLDPTAENLTDPTFADEDGDGLDDTQERFFTNQVGEPNLVDLTTPVDANLTGSGSGDFDGDGLSDEQEFAIGSNPVAIDSDGDGLDDGAEVAGTTNSFDGQPTNPALADSDGDGASDSEENGSLNNAFANAATNPNSSDTDGDELEDGYELANNTPGFALNANDDGSIDPLQAPGEDIDNDGLSNLQEFAPAGPNRLQTRADLADTDGDTLNDFVEDNFGSIEVSDGVIIFSGTNPLLTDSDGDGLDDNEEDPTLAFSPGAVPSNSDPNLLDTDSDGFDDGVEVTAGSDPNDTASVPSQPEGFVLIEDFESEGMVIDSTFNGINGWVIGSPDAGIVIDEPIEGGDQVGSIDRAGATALTTFYRPLNDVIAQIGPDSTGTLFFQALAISPNLNHSVGLTDLEEPSFFSDFEAQTVFVDSLIRVRDGGAFRDASTFRVGEWMNVWIVADNANDTLMVYFESPDGETGQVEVTSDAGGDPFDFRNGTGDLLQTLQFTVTGGAGTTDSILLVDNFYVDPLQENLNTPADEKPTGSLLPDVDNEIEITNVSLVANGDLAITFTPTAGDTFVLTSASPAELVTATFTLEDTAVFDGVDTFTVPAAFVTANPTFFFRVEVE